jgi:hypothetical protein
MKFGLAARLRAECIDRSVSGRPPFDGGGAKIAATRRPAVLGVVGRVCPRRPPRSCLDQCRLGLASLWTTAGAERVFSALRAALKANNPLAAGLVA